MTRLKAMLFDLDGTLLDSAPDMVAALNKVRAGIGLEPLPVEEVGHGVTRGAIGLLELGMPETDEHTFESWRQELIDGYAQNVFNRSSLYDGVEDLLTALDESGIPWGLVTHKPEYLTHAVIEACGLSDRVSCSVCGETLEESKPHPAPVLLACDRLGVEPAETLFAGDDLRDIAAGVAAGARTAAVYYGYGSSGLLGPLAEQSIAVKHPSDLLKQIR